MIVFGHPARLLAVVLVLGAERTFRRSVGEVVRTFDHVIQALRPVTLLCIIQLDLGVDQIDVCLACIDLGRLRALADSRDGDGRQGAEDQHHNEQLN